MVTAGGGGGGGGCGDRGGIRYRVGWDEGVEREGGENENGGEGLE